MSEDGVCHAIPNIVGLMLGMMINKPPVYWNLGAESEIAGPSGTGSNPRQPPNWNHILPLALTHGPQYPSLKMLYLQLIP